MHALCVPLCLLKTPVQAVLIARLASNQHAPPLCQCQAMLGLRAHSCSGQYCYSTVCCSCDAASAHLHALRPLIFNSKLCNKDVLLVTKLPSG